MNRSVPVMDNRHYIHAIALETARISVVKIVKESDSSSLVRRDLKCQTQITNVKKGEY
jgi:hypothetical protein